MHQRHKGWTWWWNQRMCTSWLRRIYHKWNQENIMKENANDEKLYIYFDARHISIFRLSMIMLRVSLSSFFFDFGVCFCVCVVSCIDWIAVLRTGAVSVISEIKFSVNTCSLTHIQIYLVAQTPPKQHNQTERNGALEANSFELTHFI